MRILYLLALLLLGGVAAKKKLVSLLNKLEDEAQDFLEGQGRYCSRIPPGRPWAVFRKTSTSSPPPSRRLATDAWLNGEGTFEDFAREELEAHQALQREYELRLG